MFLAQYLMIAALGLNVVILCPVIMGLLSSAPFNPEAFGPKTPALMILTSIYCSIAVVSIGLIGLHLLGSTWAVPMTVALFLVQIIYKSITVPLVGIGNVVVLTNVVVIVVQVIVLALLFVPVLRA